MACLLSGSKRFMCCGGEFFTFNAGVLADPCNTFNEMRCCVTGKNADGFGYSSTASEIAAGLGKRLDGKLVIVTGASAGIGKDAAKTFYETGATVVMACRSEAKAKAAMQWIEETAIVPEGTSKGKLVFVPIDLTSLESTKAFANAIVEMSEPLAVLMCNAGIMTTPFVLTDDGYESQFQVNYLSHYYLTMLLVDKLKASPDGARVVNISSISAAWVPFPGGCCGSCCSVLCGFGPADFSGKRWPAQSGSCCAYDPMADYAYSKAAQAIFGAELDRRVFEGTKVIVLTTEPGMNTGTEIQQAGRGSACLQCIMSYTPVPCLLKVMCMFKDTPVMASSGVYAALSDKVQRGDYYRNNLNQGKARGPAGDPKHGPPLWDLSAKCVKDKVGADVPYADAPAVQAIERADAAKPGAVAP